MVKGFKFLTDNKPKIRYIQTVLPRGHVLAPIYNHDEYVIHLVKARMQHNIHWRGHEEYLMQEINPPLLRIDGGINIGGMFQIQYTIIRGGVNSTRHIASFPLNERYGNI